MSDLSPPPVFSGLEPAIVWRHFATLCEIPRASKAEARLLQHLQSWAAVRGLPATVDAAGNLLIRKPASAGREHLPGVVLQAHLDMVCQNNAETPHDFSRDPVLPLRRDGWLVADGWHTLRVPELPDISVYTERAQARLQGQVLQKAAVQLGERDARRGRRRNAPFQPGRAPPAPLSHCHPGPSRRRCPPPPQ